MVIQRIARCIDGIDIKVEDKKRKAYEVRTVKLRRGVVSVRRGGSASPQ